MANAFDQFEVQDNPFDQFSDVTDTATAEAAGAPGFGGAVSAVLPDTRMGIAEAFGVGPEDVDIETGASFIDRLDASFSETDEEIMAKFSAAFPKGKMVRVNLPSSAMTREGDIVPSLSDVESRIVFKYEWDNPNEKVKTFEDVGVMSLGDFADVTGPVAKAIPEIAVTMATRGGTIMGTFGKLFGTAGGTHLAEEGIEELRGFNRQTFSQVLGDAFVQGTLAGLTGGTGKTTVELSNIALGRGFKLSPEEKRTLMQFNMMKKHGIPFEEITASQGAPYSAILQRLQAQSEASSRFMKEKLSRQQVSAARAIQGLQTIKDSAYDVEKGIKETLNRQYQSSRQRFETAIPKVTTREAGKDVQEAFTRWVGDSRTEVSNAYADVERLNTGDLTFDLAPASDKVKQIENAVMADVRGTDTPGSVTDSMGNVTGKVLVDGKAVNVADTPTGDLLGAIRDIKKIAEEQTNYEVVKQLRTRVGNMIETWPWEANYHKGAAKRLYSVLTDVLMNPAGPASEAYKPLMARATQMAKSRYDVLDKQTIRSTIRTDNPAKLAKKFGSPLEMTDEVMDVLKKYPEKLESFRNHTKNNLLFNKGGATNALDEWSTKDPEGLAFILGGKEQSKQFIDLAYDFDTLNNSNLKAIIDRERSSMSLADEVVTGKIDKKQLGPLLKDLGGANSEGHKLLQTSIIHRLVDKVIAVDKTTGSHIVNQSALDSELEALKNSGAIALLSKEQREKLVGIDAYVRLISPKGKDAGTSLETAKLTTGLKHPSRFLQSVHGLAMNEIIAKVLSSKAATRTILGKGKGRMEGNELISAMLLTKAFLDKEAGSAGLPIVENKNRSPY